MLVQEMACPKKFEWLVLRAGLSSDHSRACPNALYDADVAQLLYKVPSNPRVTLTRERPRVGTSHPYLEPDRNIIRN